MTKFSTMESGNNYAAFGMITEILQKEAKNGNPFLDVKLSDGDKEITAKLFDHDMDRFNHKKGDIIAISLNVSTYNGSLNYQIKGYRDIEEADGVDANDFILAAPISGEKMFDDCMSVVADIKSRNFDLGNLVENILSDNKDKLLYWSAAKTMHHNCYSGLLYHAWRMMKSAIAICSVYDSVDSDMVVAGCILHDIGKLSELDTDEFGVAEYTIDGNLTGHLVMGRDLVKEYGKRLGTNPEIIRDLSHIILSHHGKLEWGAVTQPATMEAFLVSQLDQTDAKIYMYEKAEADLEPGEITQDRAVEGVRVYRSANKI